MVNTEDTEAAAARVLVLAQRGPLTVAEFVRRHVGLHFNLTEGRALSPEAARCSSLCTPEGQFRGREGFWATSDAYDADLLAAVAAELAAQLHRCNTLMKCAAGGGIRHLDGHHHCHVTPLVIAALHMLRRGNVDANDLSTMRIPSGEVDHGASPFERNVASTASRARLQLPAGVRPAADVFIGFSVKGSDLTVEAVRQLIRRAVAMNRGQPAGVFELMTHPAAAPADAQRRERSQFSTCDFTWSADRKHELDVLTSTAFAAMLREEGCTPTASPPFPHPRL